MNEEKKINDEDIVCIYHANCADGFAAAWAVWLRYPKATFIPASYGDEIPNLVDKYVLIVDFSYSKEQIARIGRSSRSVLVIDHHDSAEKELAHLSAPFYKSEIQPSGVHAIFDMKQSGARLTWNYIHPEKSPPLIIQHVEDRDLWRFQLKETKDFMAALFSYEFTFERMDGINHLSQSDDTYEALLEIGKGINRSRAKDLDLQLKASKRVMLIGDNNVYVAGVPYSYASDAGHIMSKGQPFAATYVDTETHRKFSLRSNFGKDGEEAAMDVSLVAKEYGGGGHKPAAGFSVPRDHVLAQS